MCLQVPALDLGPSGWPATDARFAAQLSAHLGGGLSSDVLAAFQAMLRFQGEHPIPSTEEEVPVAAHVPACFPCLLPTALAGIKTISEPTATFAGGAAQPLPERSGSGGEAAEAMASDGEEEEEDEKDEEQEQQAQQEAQQAQQQQEQEEEPPLEWPRCMDDLGASNRLCSEALERVMRACPGSAQLLWGSSGGHTASESFLPFLADTL